MRKNLIGVEINGIKYGSFADKDTLDYLSYYPMHIGDKWQYRSYLNGIWADTSYFILEICGDTILTNNEKYFCISKNGAPYCYERIDTSALCVYRYCEGACTNNEQEKIFLIYCPDSSIIKYNCNDEYFETYRLDSSRIEIYHDYLTVQQYMLKKDIGVEYFSEYEVAEGVSNTLIAAIVDGVQYGEFLGVEEQQCETPKEFQLYSNYPNPFNPATEIRYAITQAGVVILSIYDLHGQLINTLVSEYKKPGEYFIVWDGKSDTGLDVASGIYFSVLNFDNRIQKKNKMIKLK